MKLYLLMLSVMLFSCQMDQTNRDQTLNDSRDHSKGAEVYKIHCAGCHGADLQGNTAPTLLRTDWKYGRTKGLMVRNVTFGIPGTEMGAFQAVLPSQDISQVVDFIRSKQGESIASEVILPKELSTQVYQIQVDEVVGSGLDIPWAIEFVDENTALISEKTGSLRWLKNGQLDQNPIEGTPLTHLGSSTGGYMDIALDPDYSKNGWIYLAFSHCNNGYSDEDAPATTKIVRGKIANHQWVQEERLFEVADSLWVLKGNRWGCRFLFDANDYLYFTIGDMGKDLDAQELDKATGKVFRIYPDGRIPSDNPFVDSTGALGAIYALGTRNVQGLSIDPVTDKIWASEHGPMGGDELNILRPGANYGWPLITYGVNYDGAIVSSKTHQDGLEQPVYQWTPSIGVCPIEFVQSEMFARWNNQLLVGALAFEQVILCKIDSDKVVSSEIILQGKGRVRDIKTAPDGSIYIVLNKPDKIIRLSLQDQPM